MESCTLVSFFVRCNFWSHESYFSLSNFFKNWFYVNKCTPHLLKFEAFFSRKQKRRLAWNWSRDWNQSKPFRYKSYVGSRLFFFFFFRWRLCRLQMIKFAQQITKMPFLWDGLNIGFVLFYIYFWYFKIRFHSDLRPFWRPHLWSGTIFCVFLTFGI